MYRGGVELAFGYEHDQRNPCRRTKRRCSQGGKQLRRHLLGQIRVDGSSLFAGRTGPGFRVLSHGSTDLAGQMAYCLRGRLP
jgi:hypothetical protein